MGSLFAILIVFVLLKTTGTVDWPWPSVLIPLWVGIGAWVSATVITAAQKSVEARR